MLGNERFTQSYCAAHELPRLGTDWLFCDVVTSTKPGTGALLLLQLYVLACQRHAGVCAVCVTKRGKSLFQALGFDLFHYREGGASRALAHARSGSLSMKRIARRLKFEGDARVLQDVCYRLQILRPERNVVARC